MAIVLHYTQPIITFVIRLGAYANNRNHAQMTLRGLHIRWHVNNIACDMKGPTAGGVKIMQF